jgi:hypothetical protein
VAFILLLFLALRRQHTALRRSQLSQGLALLQQMISHGLFSRSGVTRFERGENS